MTAISLAALHIIAELTFTYCRIIIVEDIDVTIPRRTDEVVFVLSFPVHQASDVLVLVIIFTTPGALFLRCSVVLRLTETLLLDTVLHIKAVGTTPLVTNIELTLALIQAHASEVSWTDISEYVL